MVIKIGLIGLGKMGQAIAYRVLQAGHEVFGFDLGQEARANAKKIGVKTVDSLEKLCKNVEIFWLMIPSGGPVDKTIELLLPYLKEGNIIVDGGNSNFEYTVQRAEKLGQKNVYFLDCGTSGGLHGKEIGFSLMIGGDKLAYEKVVPIFTAIAHKDGFAHLGPSGAGHYVKMVHNGIEYGLLQAYAEGFHLLKEGQYKDLDLAKIADVWRHGAIIRSWLLDLTYEILAEHKDFANIVGQIQEGGTGKWMVKQAEKQKIPVSVIKEAWLTRKRSREGQGNFATRLITFIRNKFGGHAVKKRG